MKKLILLITVLAFFGCDNSTAPTDCLGVVNGSATTDDCGVCDSDATNDCAVGSYTLTTSLSYNTSDCSGQEEESSEFIENGGSIIIELNADGIAEVNMLAGETTELLTGIGIWTQNNNNVSIIINTPLGAQSRYDEYEIGKAAIKYNIPVFTTIAGAQAVLRAIRITLNKKLTYTSLQKIFK